MGSELKGSRIVSGRVVALTAAVLVVFTIAAPVAGARPDSAGSGSPPAEPPECTAEAIGADTGMTLRPDVVCAAGFAMGLLTPDPGAPATEGAPTVTTDTTGTIETEACERVQDCPVAELFHITTSGWVHDGRHDRDCAEHVEVFFMSPYTASTFAPVCEPGTWPEPATAQRGDRSEAVMYVQIALVSQGYDVAVDGTFDATTEDAVRAFQQLSNLPDNGVAGPETHALLGTGPNPPPPPTTSTTTSTTTATTEAMTPETPSACTVDAIAADTGLPVIDLLGCAGGWALGMLQTTCPPPPPPGEEPEGECEAGELFHVTEEGWVHDGSVYPFCADWLATSTGVSIHTALQWSPVCGAEPVPDRTVIEPGSSGERVTQLQIALVALGYTIAIDGEYGPRTEAAVRDVQQRNGLEVDGIAGPVTQEAIGL